MAPNCGDSWSSIHVNKLVSGSPMHIAGATKEAERSDDLEAVRRGESAVFEKFSCIVFVESHGASGWEHLEALAC